jgi:hypothetical protein
MTGGSGRGCRRNDWLPAAVASALTLGACAGPYGPEYAYSTDPYSYGYRYSSGYYPTGYYAPRYGYYDWPRYSYGGYGSGGPHVTIAASF